MALIQLPFGPQNSGAYTPADVERKRRLAEMLTAKDIVSQEPFGALAEGLIGARSGYEAQQASEAERQGMSDYQSRLGAILADPNMTVAKLAEVAGDPWANQQQSAIVGELLGQKLKPPEPYKPDYQTFTTPEGDVMRFDNNDANAQPQMFYDAPDQPSGYQVLAAEEVSQLGLPPGSYQRGADGKISAIGEGGVTVNTGDNSNAFSKKADETAAVRMNDYVSAGNAAQTFMGDINALTEIGKTLNTGKTTQIMAALGPYAEALGLKIDDLGEAQAFDAIVARMAPQMRVPGSGASSDFDARQFLKSLPSLGNTPEGNAIIQQTFAAIQQAKMQAAAIASQALSGEITWQEADKRIAAIGDPFTAFNEYKKAKKDGGDEGWTDLGGGIRIREKK